MIANADHIAKLIPKIVSIKAIRGEGLLRIVKLSVASRKVKSVCIVHESSLAHLVDCFHVHHHSDVHFDIKRILPRLDLTANTLTLPYVPIGNMVEFCLI